MHLENLHGSPRGAGSSVGEHHHARRERLEKVRVLRDQQHARALCRKRAKALAKPLGRVGIELRGRLVEHEQRRFQRQGARQRHALPLPARQLVRQPPRQVSGVCRRECSIDATANRVARNGEILGTDGDFFFDRASEPGELRQRIVEHEAG
jgi:hypothetical protein